MIQSELPQIKSEDGKYKAPQVYFRAEDSAQDEIAADTRDEELDNEESEDGEVDGKEEEKEQGSDEQMIDGKLVKLGKIENSSEKKEDKESGRQVSSSPSDIEKSKLEKYMRGGPGEGGVESYSGQGREGADNSDRKFVRWSSSTEIGDFIRDAARGKEFAVEIEGASKEIRVGVPSFNDRTHYLRVRLRKTSRKLADLASVKKECDELAHKSAQRLAMGGFAILVSWWGAIYHFTFQTEYGWDTMEPITVRPPPPLPLPLSPFPQCPSLSQVLTRKTVLSRTLNNHARLSLVPLPQPRSLLPRRSKPHGLPAPKHPLPGTRFRRPKMGKSNRGSERVKEGNQASSQRIRCGMG